MSHTNFFLTCHKDRGKHVALQNLSIYYTWEKVRKQYNKNKIRIIVQASNDEFELLDGFYSVWDIQNYIDYIIKKYETITILPIHVYINRINNTLVFKIKDGY